MACTQKQERCTSHCRGLLNCQAAKALITQHGLHAEARKVYKPLQGIAELSCCQSPHHSALPACRRKEGAPAIAGDCLIVKLPKPSSLSIACTREQKKVNKLLRGIAKLLSLQSS